MYLVANQKTNNADEDYIVVKVGLHYDAVDTPEGSQPARPAKNRVTRHDAEVAVPKIFVPRVMPNDMRKDILMMVAGKALSIDECTRLIKSYEEGHDIEIPSASPTVVLAPGSRGPALLPPSAIKDLER